MLNRLRHISEMRFLLPCSPRSGLVFTASILMSLLARPWLCSEVLLLAPLLVLLCAGLTSWLIFFASWALRTFLIKLVGAQVRSVHALAGQLRRHQRRRCASHRAHRLDEPVRLLRELSCSDGSLMLVRLNCALRRLLWKRELLMCTELSLVPSISLISCIHYVFYH